MDYLYTTKNTIRELAYTDEGKRLFKVLDTLAETETNLRLRVEELEKQVTGAHSTISTLSSRSANCADVLLHGSTTNHGSATNMLAVRALDALTGSGSESESEPDPKELEARLAEAKKRISLAIEVLSLRGATSAREVADILQGRHTTPHE